MSRVEWTRQSADDVEATIALFLSAEFPHAERITPSRGDGGIDVLVRGEDGSRIYQVKSFTERLTAGRKRQISDSVDRLATDPRLARMTIREWHLVMPRDPTLENKKWLSQLVTDHGLPEPVWDGLTRCDLWAAKYPHVVDYYLHGGRDRISTAAGNLINLAALKCLSPTDAASLEVSGISDSLSRAMRYLNEEDPFYRYSIRVSPGPSPDLAKDLAAGRPLTVPGCALMTSWSNESMHVEVGVFPKNSLALELSPINGRVEFTAMVGTAEAQALEDFAKYGSPMSGVDISLSELEAPAGLGGAFKSGRGGFGPPQTPEGESEMTRLVVLSPAGDEVQTLMARRVYSVHGQPHDGEIRGAETLFKTDDGTTIRFRFDLPDGQIGVHFTTGDIRDRVVVELLPSLRFLAAFGAPNCLTIARRFGPLPTESTPIPQPPSEGIKWLLEVAECLGALQDLSSEPIRMPDPEALDEGGIDGIWIASQLARGVEFYATVPQIGLPPSQSAVGRRVVKFARLVPWVFKGADADLDLGFLVDTFEGVLIQPASEVENELMGIWEVVDQRITRRLATREEVKNLSSDGQWAVLPDARGQQDDLPSIRHPSKEPAPDTC